MNSFVKFCVENILDSLKLRLRYTRGVEYGAEGFIPTEQEDGSILFTLPNGGVGKTEKLNIRARFDDTSVVFSIDTDTCRATPAYVSHTSDNAISFAMGGAVKPDAIKFFYHQYTCWMAHGSCNDFSGLGTRTQNFLAKFGDRHFHVLGLCGDNFRCEFDSSGMHLSVGCTGVRDLHGDFLAITAADDPYSAIKQNYEFAREVGAIKIPLKREKKLSYIFDGLGWCTWDAFEQNVTEELIIKKLDELREKNVPIRWILIDDGWFIHEGETLRSFDADPVKFPEGIAGVVDKIKNEYGIEFVGIWHAFEGYWYGVVEGSELHSEQAENLMVTPTRFIIPSLDEEKGYAFWNEWHSRLEDAGIDFLKVDNQSSYSLMVEGAMPTAEACRHAHNAFERSAAEHFNGNVINCMGMDMENVLARPTSSISRTGEDFGCTEDIGGIRYLLLQNVYNTLWHDQLYYSDYDMWWSGKMYPELTGTLRAISGGPIYVSEGIGQTDPEMLLKVVEDDGEIMYCDHGAYPTLDCVYGIPDGIFRIWNRSGDAFAAAVYNLSDDPLEAKLDLATIPGLDEERDYVAYEYFTKHFVRVKPCDVLTMSLDPDKVAAYSVYPIYDWDGEEYIMLGDTDKIFPIASKHKSYTAVVDIL